MKALRIYFHPCTSTSLIRISFQCAENQACKRNKIFIALALASALSLACHNTAAAQELFVPNTNNVDSGTINAYSTIDGTPVPNFVPPQLQGAWSLAISGNSLYAMSQSSSKITEFNGITGATISGFTSPSGFYDPAGMAVWNGDLYVAALSTSNNEAKIYILNAATGSEISSLAVPNSPTSLEGMAVSGSNLYIVASGNQYLNEFEIYTLNVSTITPIAGFTSPSSLDAPQGIAVSGSCLYVAESGNNTIDEFNAFTGATIISELVTGLDGPRGLAILGNDLFVGNVENDTIGEYDATDGSPVVGFTSPSGVSNPGYLVASPIPEPSTWVMLAAGVGSLLVFRRRRRS